MATTADCSYLLHIAIAIATPAMATAIILHGYSRASTAMATSCIMAYDGYNYCYTSYGYSYHYHLG